MLQYIKFGQNPSFGSRNRVQTSFFGQNLAFKVPVWPWKWGQGHQNIIISFPCPSGVSIQVCSKSTNWFRRQSADKAQNLVFIVWWPSKLGQGRGNLINSFNYPNDTIHKVGQNPSFGSRDRVQTNFFRQNLTCQVPMCPWKWGHGHQNIIISSPCPSGVSMQVWSKSTKWFRR